MCVTYIEAFYSFFFFKYNEFKDFSNNLRKKGRHTEGGSSRAMLISYISNLLHKVSSVKQDNLRIFIKNKIINAFNSKYPVYDR